MVKVILGLETTFLVGWVAGLFENITNSAPNWVGLGLGLSLAKNINQIYEYV